MSMTEAALRGAATALFVLLGIIRLRDARGAPVEWFGGCFVLGVAAYTISSSPSFNTGHPSWLVPIAFVSLGNPALFWLYATATFDDEFRPSWRHFLVWLASIGLGAWCAFGRQDWACLAFDLVSLVFVALAIWHALAGRAIDLVEGRRRFRVTLIIVAALYSAVLIVSELISRGHGGHAEPIHVISQAVPAGMINAIGLLTIGFIVAVARLSHRPWDERVRAAASEAPQRRRGLDEPPAADEQEAALLAALHRLMAEQKAYREEGLSVAALAGKLDIPDYRLRRLINQRLGHRNFSTFVNGFRLAEAKEALADPGQDAVPILTIALDAGFQSIGPFNRAFRAETGMTPSEFRRARTGRAEATAAS